MQISASILTNKKIPLDQYLQALCKLSVDLFHIDFNDATMSFDQLKEVVKICKASSDKALDIHVISPRPSRYFDFIAQEHIRYASFQYEYIKEPIILPNSASTNFGLSIITQTPIEVYQAFKESCQFIMFMATTPGVSGCTFNELNFSKIKQFKQQYPRYNIHVDGGITQELLPKMIQLKVNTIVMGTLLSRIIHSGGSSIGI